MNNYMSDRPSVFLNGIESSTFKICLAERPKIPSPKRLQAIGDSQFSQRGSYRANTGWGDITINLKFNYLEDIEDTGATFRMAFGSIRATLYNTVRLEFNDDVNAYYIVKHVDIGDAENDIVEYGEFSVAFTCAPFGYLNDDGDALRFQFKKTNNISGDTIRTMYLENDGFYDCFPTIRILYTGAITSLGLPELHLQPVLHGNEINRDPNYIWDMKLKEWKPNFDLIIDSENTMVYWSDIRNPNGVYMDASKDVTMKNFPQMGVGEYMLQTPFTAGKNYTFSVEVERNRVI